MKTRKTFSEYLVEQGHISADQLAGVLVQQIKSMPTVCEVVYNQKLLSSEQTLQALNHQMKTGCEFIKACEALGFWSQDMASQVAQALSSHRVPVAQLLQKEKLVTLDVLVGALDNYLSENAEAPAIVAIAEKAVVAEAAMVESHLEVQVASLGEVTDSVGADSNHFFDFYTQSAQSVMVTLTRDWNQSDMDVTSALIDRVHGLAGAARFAKLDELEAIFKEAEQLVRGAGDMPPGLGEGLMVALRNDLLALLEKAWRMRVALHDSGSASSKEVAV